MLQRKVGETCIFTNGTERHSPQVKVIELATESRYAPLILSLYEAGRPENDLRDIKISLETLKDIVFWAERSRG